MDLRLDTTVITKHTRAECNLKYNAFKCTVLNYGSTRLVRLNK